MFNSYFDKLPEGIFLMPELSDRAFFHEESAVLAKDQRGQAPNVQSPWLRGLRTRNLDLAWFCYWNIMEILYQIKSIWYHGWFYYSEISDMEILYTKNWDFVNFWPLEIQDFMRRIDSRGNHRWNFRCVFKHEAFLWFPHFPRKRPANSANIGWSFAILTCLHNGVIEFFENDVYPTNRYK